MEDKGADDRGGFSRGFGGRGRGEYSGSRGRRHRPRHKVAEDEWIPFTKLGRLVKNGKIKTLEEIYLHCLPIKEYQIIDTLVGPSLKGEVKKIKPVQKKNRTGRRARSKPLVVDGKSNGHV